ncbi:hypothetical protein N7508_003883 [Penicillium antarcticum]|uniref:uncharacterized protein n=1 Tax=Penicillium antarcticum TaxID=416450 RepID=UPI00239D101F|nr:uncharacterized protein N7508_003883 [Penicillium antarcticum]KAJ5313053.1 hypothetical protein N7508_003883 [Penicillium antarcticum]
MSAAVGGTCLSSEVGGQAAKGVAMPATTPPPLLALAGYKYYGPSESIAEPIIDTVAPAKQDNSGTTMRIGC